MIKYLHVGGPGVDLVPPKIKQAMRRIVQKASAEQYVNKEVLNLQSKKNGGTHVW